MRLSISYSGITVGSDILMCPKVSQRPSPLLDELMKREAMRYHVVFLDIDEVVHRHIPAAGKQAIRCDLTSEGL